MSDTKRKCGPRAGRATMTSQMNMSLPPDLHQRLDIAAEALRISTAEYVRQAITAKLETDQI